MLLVVATTRLGLGFIAAPSVQEALITNHSSVALSLAAHLRDLLCWPSKASRGLHHDVGSGSCSRASRGPHGPGPRLPFTKSQLPATHRRGLPRFRVRGVWCLAPSLPLHFEPSSVGCVAGLGFTYDDAAASVGAAQVPCGSHFGPASGLRPSSILDPRMARPHGPRPRLSGKPDLTWPLWPSSEAAACPGSPGGLRLPLAA